MSGFSSWTYVSIITEEMEREKRKAPIATGLCNAANVKI
jgi:hypothetical protein